MFNSRSAQAYFVVAVGSIFIFAGAFTFTKFLGSKVTTVFF